MTNAEEQLVRQAIVAVMKTVLETTQISQGSAVNHEEASRILARIVIRFIRQGLPPGEE